MTSGLLMANSDGFNSDYSPNKTIKRSNLNCLLMHLEQKRKIIYKSKSKNKGVNEGIQKIQNDLQILSNEFREGEMQMNYIRNNIASSAKKDKVAKSGNKVSSTARRIISPPNQQK